jgi:hypothetical protein
MRLPNGVYLVRVTLSDLDTGRPVGVHFGRVAIER